MNDGGSENDGVGANGAGIAAAWADTGEPAGFAGALGRVAGRLAPGEFVRLIAPGRAGATNGLLVVTDARLLFITRQPAGTVTDGYDWASIAGVGAEGERLVVVGADGALSVERLVDGDAALVCDLVEAAVTPASEPLPVHAPIEPVRPPGQAAQAAQAAQPPLTFEQLPWYPPAVSSPSFPERHPVLTALGILVGIALQIAIGVAYYASVGRPGALDNGRGSGQLVRSSTEVIRTDSTGLGPPGTVPVGSGAVRILSVALARDTHLGATEVIVLVRNTGQEPRAVRVALTPPRGTPAEPAFASDLAVLRPGETQPLAGWLAPDDVRTSADVFVVDAAPGAAIAGYPGTLSARSVHVMTPDGGTPAAVGTVASTYTVTLPAAEALLVCSRGGKAYAFAAQRLAQVTTGTPIAILAPFDTSGATCTVYVRALATL